MRASFAAFAFAFLAASPAKAQSVTSPNGTIITGTYYYPGRTVYYYSYVPYVQQPIVQQYYSPTSAYDSPGYVNSSYFNYSAYSSPGYYNRGYRGMFGRRW